MENPSASERIPFFDYLRVFATFLVIVLHTAAKCWNAADITGLAWNTMNVYDSASRCCVPLFLMISGALFLSKEISVKKLFTKNIFRVAVAYCVWSVFYAIAIPLVKRLFHVNVDFSWKAVLINSITGHVHLWFIPLIIGMYVCLPLLKKIVEDRKTALYFLTLSFLFSFVFPVTVNIASDFIGGPFASLVSLVSYVVSNMNLNMISGYTFYMVAGYVLFKTDFNPKSRKILYLLGITGILLTILLTLFSSLRTGTPNSYYYGNITFNVALPAAAVFILFKYGVKKPNRFVCLIASHSFGIYLVHIFVLEILNLMGLNCLTFFPPLSIPVIALLILLLSFGIVYLIRKIPFIGKIIT